MEVLKCGEDTGLITYIYSCKVLTEGGQVDHIRSNRRYTSLWAKRNGTWVMVFSQDTVVAGGQ